jgi:Tetratricopeptide repeat
MSKEATQESTVVAVRGFLIWGEEFSRQGRYAAAEKLYQRAWALVERTLGHKHPMMAEVLECYSDLLVKTNRLAEGTAMKNHADVIWRAYGAPFCRNHIQANPVPSHGIEREGSD